VRLKDPGLDAQAAAARHLDEVLVQGAGLLSRRRIIEAGTPPFAAITVQSEGSAGYVVAVG
jgi:hypothetical protein